MLIWKDSSTGRFGRRRGRLSPQHGEKFVDVEELHVLLNTEPVVGFKLHDDAVQWLKGWGQALKDEAVKRKAVEKARRVKYCRL